MKKAFIYLVLVILVVVTANFYYGYSGMYAEDIRKCDAGLMLALDSVKGNSDAIYFGESSNTTYKQSDSSYASISGLIQDYSGKLKIGTVSKGAIHAGTYRALLARLDEFSSVKQIIMTVNLRSFGINWIESNLETNLSRANVLYTDYPPILKKVMLSFKAYDNKDSILRERTIKWHYKHDLLFTEAGKYKNVRDWDAFMFSKGHLNSDGTRDPEKCALACHFIKNYAFIIDDDNPRIKDFDWIVRWCEKRKIRLLMNLLPENIDKAKELCGDDLIALMKQNVNYLQNRYADKTIFINNVDLLRDSCFIDRGWPTEHYNFYGRSAVAHSVAGAL